MALSKKTWIVIGAVLVGGGLIAGISGNIARGGFAEPTQEPTAEATETPTPEPTQEPTPEPESEPATTAGLERYEARWACEDRIYAEFPYGAKPHWLTGLLAEELVDDRWFVKVDTTVENAAGNKQDVNVECYVSGTNDAPVVSELTYY